MLRAAFSYLNIDYVKSAGGMPDFRFHTESVEENRKKRQRQWRRRKGSLPLRAMEGGARNFVQLSGEVVEELGIIVQQSAMLSGLRFQNPSGVACL